jgi:O-Antigen ligase
MTIESNSSEDTHGRHTDRISFVFFFLIFSWLAQFLFNSFHFLAYFFIALSVLVLLLISIVGNRNELFMFLYLMTAMSIIIPFAPQREFKMVVPSVFFVASVIRFSPRFLHIRKGYFNILFFAMAVFMMFCFIGIMNQIKIPGINAISGENSGLLNRFNLFNSMITFATVLILFDSRFLEKWILYFFGFNLAVLAISIVIVIFDLGPFPFFNTFSWSLIVEAEGSKKLVIAGVSAAFVLIYTLVFVRRPLLYWLLVVVALFGLLISGSRISFLAGLLVVFLTFAIRRKFLGKSLIILFAGTFIGFYLLLSPVILLVPEKYQRLVILFPPSYYTGELANLAKSAAASSTSFRLEIWGMAAEKIALHPLIGNSFQAPQAEYAFEGDYLASFQKIPKEILYNDFLITGSLHNTFIGIAYLLGVPAALLFLYVFCKLIWRHYKCSVRLTGVKRGMAMFICIILINYFMYALVSDMIFDLQFLLWLAVGIKVLVFYYRDEPALQSEDLSNISRQPVPYK